MAEKKQVRCVYHVYRNSKRVEGTPEIVITEPIKGKVTFPSINEALEKTRDKAKKICDEKYKDAYTVMYSYDKIETEEEERYYCSTCKSIFTVKKVYGFNFDKTPCPKGHTKTSVANGFKCPECKKGTCYDTGKRSKSGPECVVHYYECNACGHKEAEPMD